MIPQIFKNENAYDNDINLITKRLNIPAPLIKAFIAIESAFNPQAYKYEAHRKDASYGLIQILYNTAKGIGFKGVPDDLYSPPVNINWAGKYIKYLIDTYKDYDKVFAAYNMGYPRLAKDTTKIIVGIYGKPKPDWKYANQPYVDKGLAYLAYFTALDKKDYDKAWEIYHLIMNKKYKEAGNKYSGNNLLKMLPYILVGLSVAFFIYRGKNYENK